MRRTIETERPRTWRRLALVGALAALLAPAVSAADSRVVVEKNVKLDRDVSGIAECDGFTHSEHYAVRLTLVEIRDEEDALLREILQVHFDGTATNDATGGTLPVDGQRRLVFDYQNGTFTESGVLRHVTAPGEGIVLHESGRVVEDLDDETITYFSAGKHEFRLGQWDEFCAALAEA